MVEEMPGKEEMVGNSSYETVLFNSNRLGRILADI